MLNVSADTVFNWSNWFLLASLVVGVIATYGIVASGKIKDKESKLELSRAYESAEKAKKDAAVANERAADANQKSAMLNMRAAILEKETKQARLETERLKKQFAWRTLGLDEERNFLTALQDKRIFVSIVWAGDDPERIEYARQFADALKKIGLFRGYFSGGIINPAPPPGLSVSSQNPAEGAALIAALRAGGLNPKNIGASIFGGTVLWIGPKPRPEQ